MRLNLTIRQLKIFVDLSNSLNFSRTANHFHLTQPRLSKIVNEIEDEVGVKLFRRTTRKVALTAEGQAMYAQAAEIICAFETGLDKLTTLSRNHVRTVAVAALPSYASALLPPVIESMRERDPSANVQIYDHTSDEAVDLVISGKVEFAITALECFPRELVFEAFMYERLVLVGTDEVVKSLGLCNPVQWSAEFINNLNVFSLAPGSSAYRHITRAFDAEDILFQPRMFLNSIVTALSFVKSGLGLALLPELSVALLDSPNLVRIKLNDGPSRSVGVVYQRDRELSSIAKDVISLLQALGGPDNHPISPVNIIDFFGSEVYSET